MPVLYAGLPLEDGHLRKVGGEVSLELSWYKELDEEFSQIMLLEYHVIDTSM